MSNRIWVVEMFNIDRWEPTVGVGLDRAQAGCELRRWRRMNPDDRLRLKCYIPGPISGHGDGAT